LKPQRGRERETDKQREIEANLKGERGSETTLFEEKQQNEQF
jgi:hypothetical protein